MVTPRLMGEDLRYFIFLSNEKHSDLFLFWMFKRFIYQLNKLGRYWALYDVLHVVMMNFLKSKEKGYV